MIRTALRQAQGPAKAKVVEPVETPTTIDCVELTFQRLNNQQFNIQ